MWNWLNVKLIKCENFVPTAKSQSKLYAIASVWKYFNPSVFL